MPFGFLPEPRSGSTGFISQSALAFQYAVPGSPSVPGGKDCCGTRLRTALSVIS